jgi:choline monooxygenase
VTLKEIIESYDATAPLTTASTLPASWYVNSDVADLELKTVFARCWQVAGRVEQLRKPGQFITCEVAGERLIIVRDNNDVVRAFFNVCRHHAAAVMSEPEGEASELRCPYHGWTYSLSGDLKSAPDLGRVSNFDRMSMGLVPIEIRVWKAWVLVKIDPRAVPTPDIAGLDVNGLHWLERRRYIVECNWKVFVDNYLDGGYHVPHLHKELDAALDYSEYQIEIGERFCLQWSPYRGGGRALYYWIYPNYMINRYPRAMDTNLVVPRGLDRTEVIFDFYFSDVSDEAREQNLASIEMSEQIQNEDLAICKSVQHGLGSRAYTAGRLSARREAGEHLFHRLLYADLRSSV